MEAYQLTAMDVAAMRAADRISIHYKSGKGVVRASKDAKRTVREPFAQEVVIEITTIEVCIRSVDGAADVPGTAEAHELLWLYPTQVTTETSLIGLLKAGDAVTFEFYPDCHSTDYIAGKGLHADALLMHVTRGKKRMKFEIAHSTCPNNTARMIRGVPDSDFYSRSVERMAQAR